MCWLVHWGMEERRKMVLLPHSSCPFFSSDRRGIEDGGKGEEDISYAPLALSAAATAALEKDSSGENGKVCIGGSLA